MKTELMDFIVCPKCKKELELTEERLDENEIKEGKLTCKGCGEEYKVINFVPKFTPDFTEEERNQVKESFGKKWKEQPTWGHEGETKKFFDNWVQKKYGWNTKEEYESFMKSKKVILDAGAGQGRETKKLASAAPENVVIGLELSDCAEEAYTAVRSFPHAHIVQGDIMNLPFKENTFEFIFSEGVLHHTPSTKKAFETLIPTLKKKGEIAIYVYNKKGPIREFSDDYIRSTTTKMSYEDCWKVSEQISKLGKQLSGIDQKLVIEEDIPLLKIKAGEYNLQRFIYYNVLKCFWNENFSLDENTLVNMDWYHPHYAYRHTPEEVQEWFNKNELSVVHMNVEDAGITIRGVRK